MPFISTYFPDPEDLVTKTNNPEVLLELKKSDNPVVARIAGSRLMDEFPGHIPDSGKK